MRLGLVVVVVLGGCWFYPVPERPTWDPSTGEVDCPIGNQLLATALTAMGTAVTIATIRSGQPSTPDPNVVNPWVSGPMTALLGALATYDWITYRRCRQLGTQVEAFATATDCAAVLRIEDNIASLDPDFRTVIASHPRVLRCHAEGAARVAN